MTLQEQRDVIQAAIDGKAIERRPLYKSLDGWSLASARFNFIDYEYRVKPEPPRAMWYANRQYIELTPAVRAACEAYGIEVPNE